MSDADPKLALNNAVLEWKRKHRIQEADPILANLEILEIYFNYRYGVGPITKRSLPEFVSVHADARSSLATWERVTAAAEWSSMVEACQSWPSADLVHVRQRCFMSTQLEGVHEYCRSHQPAHAA